MAFPVWRRSEVLVAVPALVAGFALGMAYQNLWSGRAVVPPRTVVLMELLRAPELRARINTFVAEKRFREAGIEQMRLAAFVEGMEVEADIPPETHASLEFIALHYFTWAGERNRYESFLALKYGDNWRDRIIHQVDAPPNDAPPFTFDLPVVKPGVPEESK